MLPVQENKLECPLEKKKKRKKSVSLAYLEIVKHLKAALGSFVLVLG